jgi:hypothetical protein
LSDCPALSVFPARQRLEPSVKPDDEHDHERDQHRQQEQQHEQAAIVQERSLSRQLVNDSALLMHELVVRNASTEDRTKVAETVVRSCP